jgi:hypothetical protein
VQNAVQPIREHPEEQDNKDKAYPAASSGEAL